MGCTRRFLSFQWESHRWQKMVTGTEIVTSEEPDMWARPVFRDYIRCDKAQVCEVCGKVRHPVSCICDVPRGEVCKPRVAYLKQVPSGQ
jgi:hypothetical protein